MLSHAHTPAMRVLCRLCDSISYRAAQRGRGRRRPDEEGWVVYHGARTLAHTLIQTQTHTSESRAALENRTQTNGTHLPEARAPAHARDVAERTVGGQRGRRPGKG